MAAVTPTSTDVDEKRAVTRGYRRTCSLVVMVFVLECCLLSGNLSLQDSVVLTRESQITARNTSNLPANTSATRFLISAQRRVDGVAARLDIRKVGLATEDAGVDAIYLAGAAGGGSLYDAALEPVSYTRDAGGAPQMDGAPQQFDAGVSESRSVSSLPVAQVETQ